MKRNLAIVPAYNEAGAIGSTVASIGREAQNFDVLVLDAFSGDAHAATTVYPRKSSRLGSPSPPTANGL